MKHFITVLLFHITLNFVFSQSNDTVIAEVIIQEHRISTPIKKLNRTVSILSKAEIQKLPYRSLPELLSFVQGVDIRQRGIGGIQADVNLRGGTFDQTLVLIDGVALADPQSGHHALNVPIDMNVIERIEILKGSAARSLGPNAFAGAINIITKKDSETSVLVHGQYGSNNTLTYGANVNLGSKDDKAYGLRLAYTNESSDGYRVNTDYTQRNLLGQAYFSLFGQRFDAVGGNSGRKFGGSGYYAGPVSNSYVALPIDNNTEEYEEINNTFGSLRTRFNVGTSSTQIRLSSRYQNDDYYFVRTSPVFNSTKSWVNTADVNTTLESSLGTTGIGVSYQYTDFSSLKLDTTTRELFSTFIEQTIKTGALNINLGAMYSYYSDFKGGFFPGIDVGYQVNEGLRFFSSLNRSLRIPTYTDLYFKNGSNLNNPNLTPEKTLNFEFGIKHNTRKMNSEITFFQRNGSNVIDRTKVNTTDKWFPTNFGKLTINGIEASTKLITTNGPIKFITLGTTIITNVDYVQAAEVKLSRYAADQLRYQVNGAINVEIAKNLNQTINARWFERYTLPKGFEQYYRGLLLDYKVQYNINSLEVHLQLNNILNKKYTESNGITMPGFWVSSGASLRIGK
jgi:vitamin B12 transporter